MEENRDIIPLFEKYLDDDISLSEEARINEWIENDHELLQWLSEQVDLSTPFIQADVRQRLDSCIAAKVPVTEGSDQSEHFEKGYNKSSDSSKKWKWGFAASIAVLIAVCGIFASHAIDEEKVQEFMVDTEAGERSMATLPDGSTIRLNHLSGISYHYDKKEKQRVLNLRGEATFDIETDPEHPFIVNCDGLKIECHGTSFNVKGYPDENEITVVLRDGAITASTSKQAVKMKPGTKVLYDKRSKNLQSSMVDVIDYDGWSVGNDRFDNASLDEIMKTMSRRYGVKISILTPSLRTVRLSGSIGRKDLEETLQILSVATGSKYIMESDSTISFYKP